MARTPDKPVRDIVTRRRVHPAPPLEVRVKAFGPDSDEVEELQRRLLAHAMLRPYLARTRHRVLSVDLLGDDDEGKSRRPVLPDRFRATIVDYTHARTLTVSGRLDNLRRIDVEESAEQPLPSTEEFAAAVRLLARHGELGPLIRESAVRPYPPMPPLVGEVRPDGRVERVIGVGLLPGRRGAPHEIVGVNLGSGEVVRFPNRAPANAQAHNPICGQPRAGQATQSHVAGEVSVVVTQAGTVLWRFNVVRPAASSGTNGSGIELRYVDYRGKRVLYRAHVPILNVKYDGDACGPYRDWQNQEGMFQATGTDVAPGFRLCKTPATTILDTGNDTGNFNGVAIYVEGQEVVLVSEMEAGWYRYISMWRLGADGTIRPRFGFSAVESSCVCNVHHHHCYWRLDFDIRTAANNRVREFNNPCLPYFCPSNWHDKVYEILRPRDPGRQRHWRVDNMLTGEAYDIIPGPNDGVATASPDWPFGRGDLWVLRYHPNEFDDGVVATGPPYEAGLDAWLTGEPVLGQDVVIWYGAHFTHDVNAEPPGVYGDLLGPDLRLVKW